MTSSAGSRWESVRVISFLLVVVCAVLGSLSAQARIFVEGLDSGVSTLSPTVPIADGPPLGDVLEFQLFYAPNAGNGQTTDYDGMAPILESSLVLDGAHLFFLEKGGELAFFVVYKRDAGTQSAESRLSTAGDFVIGDVIVQDAAQDTYEIDAGDITTRHRITIGGRTDGYVAALEGREFDTAGDVMTFDFETPAEGTSDLPFTSIQVFAGTDGGGLPIWVEIDSGPFSATTPRRVRFTQVEDVPAASSLGQLGLGLLLAAVGVASMRIRRRELFAKR